MDFKREPIFLLLVSVVQKPKDTSNSVLARLGRVVSIGQWSSSCSVLVVDQIAQWDGLVDGGNDHAVVLRGHRGGG
jgi:hypothetical protein